jgi:4-amino-4-deoxy-L-arabinose transferase-like glycosyltransferase
MLATCLAAFGLRAFRLGYQELRGDEAFGYFFSLRTFGGILRATLQLAEPHPVASYYVEKVWLGFAGDSEWSLRFASLWWSVLAVALLYLLGRLLGFRRDAAILSAGLMAINPYMIWHAQDARMYGMSLALTLASTCLMVILLRRPRPGPWLGYVVITWLALQTHYFNAFVILAQSIWAVAWLLLTRRSRRILGWWLAAGIAVTLLYVPWLIAARGILSGYGGNGDSPGLVAMLQRSLSVFAVGESSPQPQRVAAGLLCGLLVVIGAIRLLTEKDSRSVEALLPDPTGAARPQKTEDNVRPRWAAALLLLYLLVLLAATWLSALSRPIFNERYLVAAAPPCYLLIAAAVARPWPLSGRSLTEPRQRKRSGGIIIFAASLVALVILGLLSLARHYTDPAYSKTRGWRELAATIIAMSAGLPAEAVAVAQNFPDPTLWYYYRGPATRAVLPPAAHDATGAETEAASLAASGVQRVILPDQPAAWWDDSGIAEAALDRAWSRVAETTVDAWPVKIYARPPAALTPINQGVRDGPVLAEASVEPARLPPGGLITVYLGWTGDAASLDGSEQITMQLLDASGNLVAQADRPFLAADIGGAPVAYGILVPQTVAPGPYQVIAALYRLEQGGFTRLLTAGGRDYIPLATVTIE